MEKINIGPSFIGNNFIPENNIGESIRIIANKINEIIDVLSDCEGNFVSDAPATEIRKILE